MAKQGRKPTNKSMSDMDAALVADVQRAVGTETSLSLRALYGRFSLAERGVGWAGFEKWAGKIRRESRGRIVQERLASMDDRGESEEQLIATLRRRVLVEANVRAECGDTKAYELIGLWSRIMDHEKLKLDIKDDAREQAKFDAWLEEKSKALRAAVDAKTPNGETLTRADVYDLVDAAMRGNS